MPILANVLVDPIKDDEPRYLQMIADRQLIEVGPYAFMGIGYKLYEGKDLFIPALKGCRLVVLFKGMDCVYSCYYKVGQNEYFGRRVVQVEVRQAPHLPGLARAFMKNYFLRHYDSIRTDLGSTPQGRQMWNKFYLDHRKKGELFFYHGVVNIDVNTPDGMSNQDASNPEIAERLFTMSTASALMRQNLWHDNKCADVAVIYASNKSLRTPE